MQDAESAPRVAVGSTADSTILTYLVQMNPAKLTVPQENLEGFAFIFYQSMMNLANLATGQGVPNPRIIVDAIVPEEAVDGATGGGEVEGEGGGEEMREGGEPGAGGGERGGGGPRADEGGAAATGSGQTQPTSDVTVEEMIAAVKEEQDNDEGTLNTTATVADQPVTKPAENTGGFFKLTARRGSGSSRRVHPT